MRRAEVLSGAWSRFVGRIDNAYEQATPDRREEDRLEKGEGNSKGSPETEEGKKNEMSLANINLSPSNPNDYVTFLAIKKLPRFQFVGRTAVIPEEYLGLIGLEPSQVEQTNYMPHRGLFDYQADISKIAIAKQKYALFVAPGYGKTFMQTEFTNHAIKCLPPGKSALMIAPPMVVPQTVAEIDRFYGGEMKVEQVSAKNLAWWMTNGESRIGITNYEALKDETPQGRLGALICDETSCWKNFASKWAAICLRLGRGLDWKMSATGTPAPNDRIEYANQAVFLDQYPTVNSFLARFFVNRGQTQNRWELKSHALRPFYTSLSHWCVFLNNPATYGWKDNAGTIPPIHVHIDDVPMTDEQKNLAMDITGSLIYHTPGGIGQRSKLGQLAKGKHNGARIQTEKPEFIRRMVATWPDESTIIWCIYNDEQDRMEEMFPDAASIRGDTSFGKRVQLLDEWKSGQRKVLISKGDVLGFGLNLQKCSRMIFSGLKDSYETLFQCVKRANRVGSSRPLHVHIPITTIERPMVETVLRKQHMIESDTIEQERLFREIGMSFGKEVHVS